MKAPGRAETEARKGGKGWKMISFETDREAFLKARDSGIVFETDGASFDYFLEVLPPAWMGRRVSLPDGRTVRASFGFAEGWECVTAFWCEGDRFYVFKTNQMNPNR